MSESSAAIAWLPAFREFIKLFDIPSKEFVKPGKIKLYRAQEILLEQLTAGMSEGTRHYVFLKARQLGVSTVMILLDLFWCYVFPGTQGAFVADSAENLDIFRETIVQLLESLPKGFKIPIKKHNRSEIVFDNGSRLQYMAAGKGKKIGISRALNYVHATECGLWTQDYEDLTPSMSKSNPNRLYIFESTAFGLNDFHKMWEEAKANSPAQRAVFAGWWAKELYAYAEGTPEYKLWWDSQPYLSEEEEETTEKVLSEFNYQITDEQWAWYRSEIAIKSESSMKEKYPSYPEEAFQATGDSFFPIQRVHDDILMISQIPTRFSGYEYKLGDNFLNMTMIESDDIDGLDLRVWEKPRPNARYVIGCDPSYGRNAEADRHVISVWRAYADKIVQVAEYCTSIPDTRQCSWVLAHLCGVYRDSMINLEVNGPGMNILQEIESLKQLLSWGSLRNTAQELHVSECLEQARWFLYYRADGFGANGFSKGWKTTMDNKLSIMNSMRDAYNTEQLIVRSQHLLGEMMTMRQDGDQIEASGRNHDDRVMGAALALHAWKEWIRMPLMAEGRTWEKENNRDREVDTLGGEDKVLRFIVPSFLSMQAHQRSEAQLRSILED